MKKSLEMLRMVKKGSELFSLSFRRGLGRGFLLSLFTFHLSIFLTSCSAGSQEKAAQARYDGALALVQEGRWDAAKTELDSIHILYRQQVPVRRQAKALQDSITYLEAQRTLAYSDSVLQVLLPQVDPLLKKFRYEKDDKYESNGQYVSRLLTTDRNMQRCFLQAYVGDNRVTRVKSYYYGKGSLVQTEVELCLNGNEDCNAWQGSEYHFYPTLSDKKQASPDDTDEFHSILTVEGDPAIELLAFIAGNPEAKIRVRLHGKSVKGKERTPYTYVLSKNDKDALTETLQLATLFHDINRLEEMLNTSKKQIEKLSTRQI